MKSNASEVNYALAQTELAEAIAQLQAISKLRKKVH
ncbi:MAG: ATP synthase delta/epsilon chain alpha-helix domain-containing protein [Methylophilaceae bacterium]